MRARDYNTNWITASAILDEDTYLGAENSFNLFTLAKNSDAAADEERNHLEVSREPQNMPRLLACLVTCSQMVGLHWASEMSSQLRVADRRPPARPQVVGGYHLGEFVNRFRAGSLVMKMPDSEAAAIPTMLFATINGVIGLVASLPKAQFDFLNRLQV